MSQARSDSELQEQLLEQRRALSASCQNFDDGEEWEATRLATTIYTLVHDGPRTRSLLTQLRVRGKLRFLSSGRHDPLPGLLLSSPPLLVMKFDQKGGRFIPKFGDGAPGRTQLVKFSAWWEKEFIFKDHASIGLTRKRLVFSLRNQDGGSHVGELTDESYVRLKSGAGWFIGVANTSPTYVKNLVSASMRQVAWELTETLKQL